MKNFIKEFKAFISRGNVLDMAVGIIIGGAFTAIVTSLVENVITPIIGMVLGGIDFAGITITVGSASLGVGLFINSVITFLLTALVLFSIIKAMNSLHKKKEQEVEEKPEEPAPTPEDILLLQEIRDLLKEQQK